MKKILYKELQKFPLFGKKILLWHEYMKMNKKLEKVLIPNLSRQLRFKNKELLFKKSGSKIKILIPWAETQHYMLFNMLIIAKALELRGAEVKILVCDGYLDACEMRNHLNEGADVCRLCKIMQKKLMPIFGIDTVKISELIDSDLAREIRRKAIDICRDYPSTFDYLGIDLIYTAEESIVRHYLGGDPPSEAERSRLRLGHLMTTMICAEAARLMNDVFHPDILLGQLWVYSMGRPFFTFFEKTKTCKNYCIGMVNQNYSAFIINELETYFHNDRFKEFLKLRNGKKLAPQEKAELQGWFNERFKGLSSFHVEFGGFQEFNVNNDLEKMLKIDKRKRNLFLFPNLFWDAGMNEAGFLFRGIPEWVVSTVNIVKEHPDVNLYIKPHIVETFGDPYSKGVLDFVKEKFPVFPKNVIPVLPEWRISPYQLFPYMDAAVVYNSTLGIESIYKDIPVIIAARSQYSDLGLAWEPKTIEEYEAFLLDKNLRPKHDKEMFELFCYYYFIKRPVPFNLAERVSSNVHFERYKFNDLDEIMPGKNYMLDHLCDCIMKAKLPEAW